MKPYYEHGGITIYHGDCREVLRELGCFDLMLTDPPYGIGADRGVGKYGRMKIGAESPEWDGAPVPVELLDAAMKTAKRSIVWGGNYFRLQPSRKFLVWDKGAGFSGRDFAECEQAWCSWDGNAQIFRRDPLASGDYRGKQHPTEKPEALMLWCLSIAGPSRNVLDPFMGSGTTLVAAKRLGKFATGIEREERYCEIAAKRLEQEVLPLEMGA